MLWLFCIIVAVLAVVVALVWGDAIRSRSEWLIDRLFGQPRRPSPSRKVQLPGRDHACDFPDRSIFCQICGRTESDTAPIRRPPRSSSRPRPT